VSHDDFLRQSCLASKAIKIFFINNRQGYCAMRGIQMLAFNKGSTPR